MSWSRIKAWLGSLVGTVTFGYSSQGGDHPRIIISLSYAYKDGILNRFDLFRHLCEISEAKYHLWHVEESDIDYIINQIDMLVKEGSFNIDTLKLVLDDTELSQFVYVTDALIDFDKDTEGTPIQILSYDTRQKEADMQTQQNELQFELNQFPPDGRFHLKHFFLVLANARLAGTWRVSDAVAIATFRELSAKEDVIEHMTDNFDVTLIVGHEVREGHEAVAWNLHSTPNLLTRNGYYTPRTSKHKSEGFNFNQPLNPDVFGTGTPSYTGFSRDPYSAINNEALVDMLGHHSLTQTLRYMPHSIYHQMPGGIALLDLVCERLIKGTPAAQVAYPPSMNHPHGFGYPFHNDFQQNSYINPLRGQYEANFAAAQAPMSCGEFKATPNRMETMIHINRVLEGLCKGREGEDFLRMSQEIHTAISNLPDGNLPQGETLFLLVGNINFAQPAVLGGVDPRLYTGWVIVNAPSLTTPQFSLYNSTPRSRTAYSERIIPTINFQFAVGDNLLDTMANIANQMKAQGPLPLNATVDLLAQIQRVLENKPVDSNEHVTLNFSMGPRSTFSEGLKRAMEDTCIGCWIIYTDKTISDDTNDLPERFWFLELKQDLGAGHW